MGMPAEMKSVDIGVRANSSSYGMNKGKMAILSRAGRSGWNWNEEVRLEGLILVTLSSLDAI